MAKSIESKKTRDYLEQNKPLGDERFVSSASLSLDVSVLEDVFWKHVRVLEESKIELSYLVEATAKNNLLLEQLRSKKRDVARQIHFLVFIARKINEIRGGVDELKTIQESEGELAEMNVPVNPREPQFA